ncbi:MAG: hypothetical protein PHI27_04585 [Eubacteriales bacterium]|nr:hypothetical protein [Eubacteriales bacterium]MDD3881510.1 hypothetical protein [Eubacteriales bacterium]MDD4513008.1 hypothetical protein [Eubacteriales bacterium]
MINCVDTNFASYYKCALQVNPYCYAAFRGEQVMDESVYNERIAEKCVANGISIVGLANHGNVDSSESLREVLENHGIVTFPGFEIMSAEKIHMVCLFPESKTVSELNRYLGALGLGDSINGNETSSLPCLDIASYVVRVGGFWYAAHITSENGILALSKMHNIWRNDLLIAAQIPDSKENIDPRYKNIIANTDPAYKRKTSPCYINACDVDKPEDLEKDTATVLVKMTTPTFECFKVAFMDAESRIRLNSEVEYGYQSSINRVCVFGGYLNGLDVKFSNNLVTIIGGRGAGKSTLINLIRYAFNRPPMERERLKEFDDMIEHNLGNNARIEVCITSYSQHGREYKITRRYNGLPIIEDTEGNVLEFHVDDLLPSIEIFGQNEIAEAVRSVEFVYRIVQRLFLDDKLIKDRLSEAYERLRVNSSAINDIQKKISKDEVLVAELPTKRAKLKYYIDAGLGEKLPILKKLAEQEAAYIQFIDSIPSAPIDWPHIQLTNANTPELECLRELWQQFEERVNELSVSYSDLIAKTKEQAVALKEQWNQNRRKYDEPIQQALAGVQGIHDKTSSEMVAEYSELLRQVELGEPVQNRIESYSTQLLEFYNERRTIIENCNKCWDAYIDSVSRQLKRINKRMEKSTIKISIDFRQDKAPLLDMLLGIPGIGEKTINGIAVYPSFDVFQFADDVRAGTDVLKSKYSISQAIADKIYRGLDQSKLLEIEGFRLKDVFNIELFVNGRYKPLRSLSKGQQCTAILSVLLVDNKDPLIIDQPEDNLDNAYIAESLIATIRQNKTMRQYIFATHNANIPVFGDAELIITMAEEDGLGSTICDGVGSIDIPTVKNYVIKILEGGENAFRMRELKYGI